MARAKKIIVALGLTVALHAVVAIYALGPRLSGLAGPETASPVEEAADTAPKAAAEIPAASIGKKAPTKAEAPLDVALVQAVPQTPAPVVEAAPKPESETIAKTEVKPETKPDPVIEKPVDAPATKVAEPPAEKPASNKPERVAAKPVDKPLSKKEQQLAARKAAAAAAAEAAAAAAEAAKKVAAAKLAAKPEVAAKPATASKPSNSGATAAAAAVLSADSGYANRVRQHLAKFAGALPPGANGEARVQFVVQPDGHVTDVHLVRFSGNVGLDTVALKLPTQAQPLPLPGAVPQRLEVPVQATAPAP